MKASFGDGPSQTLLQMAQAGDRVALNRLLAVSQHYLHRMAHSQIGQRLQGKADSSDVVQDAMIEIHRQFGQFRGTTEAEYSAWLRTIVAGLVGNYVRHFLGTKQRDTRLEQTIAIERSNSSCTVYRQLAADTETPSDEAVKHENAEELNAALANLPEHYRQVITLRNLEGLPFSQVADRMSRSIDSVEKLWVRALCRLREQMKDKKLIPLPRNVSN